MSGERGQGAASDNLAEGQVRELIRLMEDNDILELSVRWGGTSVRMRRSEEWVVPAVRAAGPVARETHAAHVEPAAEDELVHVVASPMVGTYYAAARPGATPLVVEGDVVETGQLVGVIEAMKMMNDVQADVGGRVTRILVANGQPVEYGQPLMVVQPL